MFIVSEEIFDNNRKIFIGGLSYSTDDGKFIYNFINLLI
jgi:hypothetical protein